MDWLLPEADALPIALRLLIDLLGMAAAIATGRSFASSWSPVWLIAPGMLALAAGLQFLHFALFQETLASPYYYGVTFLAVLIVAALGYRSKRALQMGTQYRWMFHSSGMFWSERARH